VVGVEGADLFDEPVDGLGIARYLQPEARLLDQDALGRLVGPERELAGVTDGDSIKTYLVTVPTCSGV
jgi:hypothetical protein